MFYFLLSRVFFFKGLDNEQCIHFTIKNLVKIGEQKKYAPDTFVVVGFFFFHRCTKLSEIIM